MTTKFIGLKDFRQNIARYAEEARQGNIRIIVLKKNVPSLEVKAIDEKEFAFEELAGEVRKSRQDAKKGRLYSQEEILKEFNLL